MPEPVACSLCGGSERTTLFRTHDRLFATPERYQYVRCARCGLVYLDPQPTWDERAARYAESYRGYHRLETEPSPLQRRSMNYGLWKRWRIISKRRAGGRLLDVGCGGGDFLDWVCQQPHWSGYGMERVAGMARTARDRYGRTITLGDLLSAGFVSGAFDVVTLWTVLEHLPDPAQGLAECARLLRPNGLLIVRTVTEESWGRRLFGPCWVGYDAPRITVVFSRPTLRRLLAQSGFEVLDLGGSFHDFHPYLWSWRNTCAAIGCWPWLCAASTRLLGSWPVRLVSFPFFALQTTLGGNSFVTAIARKR